MCGFYYISQQISQDTAFTRTESMEKRGPDNFGHLVFDKMSFTHRRLSILDLDERSNQPFKYQNYICIFNGEIYNFRELRFSLVNYDFTTDGDTEVLVKLFVTYGPKMLDLLIGMFSLVIYNSDSGEIFAARDRLGQKPFYYSLENGVLQASSRLDCIVHNNVISRSNMDLYLSAGHIHAPYTVYKNVYKLKAGHYFTWKKGETDIVQNKYWSSSQKNNETSESLFDLLSDSVRYRTISDVPCGVFLSGGVDSTVIASFARKHGLKRTLTIGFDNDNFDESKFSQEYSKILKLENTRIIFESSEYGPLLREFENAYDEPFADNSALSTLLLCKLAKTENTVCLSGDGADELFYGYNHHKYLEFARWIFILPRRIRIIFARLLPEKIKKVFLLDSIDEFIVAIFVGFHKLDKPNRIRVLEDFQNVFDEKTSKRHVLALLNASYWLESDSNVKVDRASMNFSLEIRSPFMDHRLYSLANKLSDREKRFFGKTKLPIRRIFNNLIPIDKQMKGKKGFDVPIWKILESVGLQDVQRQIQVYLYPHISKERIGQIEGYFKSAKDKESYQAIWKFYVAARWIRNSKK